MIMSSQGFLFAVDDYVKRTKKGKIPKKRVHYKNTTYTKKYSLITFNEDTGEYVKDSDEKHIYRLKTLHNIYSLLFTYVGFSPFVSESVINRLKHTRVEDLTDWELDTINRIEELNNKGFTIHFDGEFGNQLEIKGTEMQSIKERLKAHIALLRRLRKGERL